MKLFITLLIWTILYCVVLYFEMEPYWAVVAGWLLGLFSGNIFYAALPGMSKVRIELRKDAAKKDEEIARLRRKVQGQAEMMRSIESVIRQTDKDSLDQIIKVLEMHNQGKYFCRDDSVQEGLRN